MRIHWSNVSTGRSHPFLFYMIVISSICQNTIESCQLLSFSSWVAVEASHVCFVVQYRESINFILDSEVDLLVGLVEPVVHSDGAIASLKSLGQFFDILEYFWLCFCLNADLSYTYVSALKVRTLGMHIRKRQGSLKANNCSSIVM